MNTKASILLLLLLFQSSPMSGMGSLITTHAKRVESVAQSAIRWVVKNKNNSIKAMLVALIIGGTYLTISNKELDDTSLSEGESYNWDGPYCGEFGCKGVDGFYCATLSNSSKMCDGLGARAYSCCTLHTGRDFFLMDVKLRYRRYANHTQKKPCVKGCSWIDLKEKPYVPVRDGAMVLLSEDERQRLANKNLSYQYALCEKGSLLEQFKNNLTESGFLFWNSSTQDGEGEGILFPIKLAKTILYQGGGKFYSWYRKQEKPDVCNETVVLNSTSMGE